MKCIWSPNNLEVLIHCHCSGSVHPRIDAPAVMDAIKILSAEGLIIQSDRHYVTTDKGKFYLDHLLSIPFPIQEYRIPEI